MFNELRCGVWLCGYAQRGALQPRRGGHSVWSLAKCGQVGPRDRRSLDSRCLPGASAALHSAFLAMLPRRRRS